MYIGNIVTETIVKDIGLFYVTKDIKDIKSGIPTLIIGWSLTKELMSGKKISILEKKINKNLYWTFTKKERRIDFEMDYEKFIERSIVVINNSVGYRYINLLNINYSIAKKIIETLTSTRISYIYISRNSFIYAYVGKEIIGIDLNVIDFLKIDRKKMYKILYSNNNEVFFNDDFLSKDLKKVLPINNNKIIPYLYKISKDGN